MGQVVQHVPFSVVCVQVWSSDKAPTCPGLLIHSQSHYQQTQTKKRKRSQKTLSCFQNEKLHNDTLSVGGRVFATQWTWNFPILVLIGEVVTIMWQGWQCCRDTDHFEAMSMTLLHLMTDNATLRCRDERRGRWQCLGFFISFEGSSRF